MPTLPNIYSNSSMEIIKCSRQHDAMNYEKQYVIVTTLILPHYGIQYQKWLNDGHFWHFFHIENEGREANLHI